jgi:hypothetical protein
MDALLAGRTKFKCGRFWYLTLIKLKKKTKQSHLIYKMYFQKHLIPSLKSIGGKVVLAMLDNVRTVIPGGNLVPNYDICTILSFPSPASLQLMESKYLYVSGLKMCSSIIDAKEIHVFDGYWNDPTKNTIMKRSQPTFDYDMKEPTRLANEKMKNKKLMGQIVPTDSTYFMNFLNDDRFKKNRIWQLNLLKLEKNDYYKEYGLRANDIISTGKTGGSGGIKFGCGVKGVHTLNGNVQYDTILCMQYPSRNAFVKFASSQNGKQKKNRDARNTGLDRHILRTAGLHVQGLICLSPDAVNGIQDPCAPNYARL